MRLTLAALLACAAASATASAVQDPPGQPPAEQRQQPPIFRTGTNVVRVDVTVTDKSGVPIRTLTADDFEIFEDDRPQPITTFKLVEATGFPTDDYALPIRNPEHAAAEAARDDVRVFVIFWDEYHIGQFASALRAREQLKRFVLEAFGPTDLVALVDPLTPIDAIRFTRDRRALADQIAKLQGRQGVYMPPRSGVEQAHLRSRRPIEVVRSEVTITALKAVMMHLGALREGRKSIIMMAENLGPIPQVDLISDLIRTANHTNTALFTFDPRGLQVGRTSNSAHLLRAVADGSGGGAFTANDMAQDLLKVVSRSSAYYMLGYQPDRPALDGRFRKIDVRVKPRGVDVQARAGYWQPRADEIARAAAVAAASVLPAPIASALTELTPANSHRPIDFWAGFTTSGKGTEVTVAWAPRPGFSGAEEPAWVDVTASVDGEESFEGKLEGPSLSFPAAAGEVEVVATARNAEGDILDKEVRAFTIPPASETALGLSTPVVLRARTPLEVRGLDNGTGAAAATREFARTDRLRVRVAPFGQAASGATMKAALLGPKGAELTDLPVRQAAGYHEVDLPLTSIAKGEFLIRVEALNDEHRAEALVAFRVK